MRASSMHSHCEPRLNAAARLGLIVLKLSADGFDKQDLSRTVALRQKQQFVGSPFLSERILPGRRRVGSVGFLAHADRTHLLAVPPQQLIEVGIEEPLEARPTDRESIAAF